MKTKSINSPLRLERQKRFFMVYRMTTTFVYEETFNATLFNLMQCVRAQTIYK